MDATQKKGSPKQLRCRSLGTTPSEAEYVQCEKSAARRGQRLSECPPGAARSRAGPAQAPEAEVILSEILALRKIAINLLYGDKAGEPLSEERMRELIEAADSEKLRKAAERLHAAVTARAGVLSDDHRGESVPEPPGEAPGRLAGASPLRVHISAQHGVDPGLIPSALLFEPFHDLSVQAQRDGLLRLGHDDPGRLEPGCVDFRSRIRVRQDGAPNIVVGLRIDATPVRRLRHPLARGVLRSTLSSHCSSPFLR